MVVIRYNTCTINNGGRITSCFHTDLEGEREREMIVRNGNKLVINVINEWQVQYR